ncbi:hypothetical protein BGX23_001916 [Mortierella sp. AD031]|nr:hypothetical protein BGX23_001916 [Mortierella sp. AD031]
MSASSSSQTNRSCNLPTGLRTRFWTATIPAEGATVERTITITQDHDANGDVRMRITNQPGQGSSGSSRAQPLFPRIFVHESQKSYGPFTPVGAANHGDSMNITLVPAAEIPENRELTMGSSFLGEERRRS